MTYKPALRPNLDRFEVPRDDDGQTWLRLGDPPSPVPVPFGALLHQLAATRHDHVPANHASSWLFPGRHAGQPASYRGMLIQLRDLGLRMRTARISKVLCVVIRNLTDTGGRDTKIRRLVMASRERERLRLTQKYALTSPLMQEYVLAYGRRRAPG